VSQLDLFGAEERPAVASPRQFTVRQIGAIAACELNAIWHSRVPLIDWSNVVRNRFYVCYALEHFGVSYGVAIWSSPVAANRLKDGQRLLELRRLALSPECPKNSATWMLAQMQKDIAWRLPEIIRLISYQDTEVHQGTIYKAANWRLANVQTEGQGWTTGKRARRVEQTMAPKNRWEMDMRKEVRAKSE
jgi:hypothetical protein